MTHLQCQRCRLPLLPHDSITDISNAQFNLLTNKPRSGDAPRTPTRAPSSRLPPVSEDGKKKDGDQTPVTIQAPNFGMPNQYSSPGESFVMLTESLMAGAPANTNGRAPPNTTTTPTKTHDQGNTSTNKNYSISNRLDTLESLFETLSAKSDIDYPVCNDCAELIREGLKAKYEESCNERDMYISFLNKLKDQPGAGSEEVEELSKEIESLEQDNQSALKELKEAEQEREQMEKELAQLQIDSQELQKEEDEFYKKQNQFALSLAEYANEKDRLEAVYENNASRLQQLQKVNVYNDVFCIGHDGHFGTINGLRLGRLRDKKVEWSEINAAWGQTLLLMATVIQKLNFKLVGYRLRPLGSVSRIEKLESDPKVGGGANSSSGSKSVSLELYSSGDYTFERLLNRKKLDSAMVAFLVVLKQVGQHVESLDQSLKLPYVIEDDKIGGHSIRLSINTTYESWTNACKYVLTNAKWILAYASTRADK